MSLVRSNVLLFGSIESVWSNFPWVGEVWFNGFASVQILLGGMFSSIGSVRSNVPWGRVRFARLGLVNLFWGVSV